MVDELEVPGVQPFSLNDLGIDEKYQQKALAGDIGNPDLIEPGVITGLPPAEKTVPQSEEGTNIQELRSNTVDTLNATKEQVSQAAGTFADAMTTLAENITDQNAMHAIKDATPAAMTTFVARLVPRMVKKQQQQGSANS